MSADDCFLGSDTTVERGQVSLSIIGVLSASPFGTLRHLAHGGTGADMLRRIALMPPALLLYFASWWRPVAWE